jgi:hypothetical protein
VQYHTSFVMFLHEASEQPTAWPEDESSVFLRNSELALTALQGLTCLVALLLNLVSIFGSQQHVVFLFLSNCFVEC